MVYHQFYIGYTHDHLTNISLFHMQMYRLYFLFPGTDSWICSRLYSVLGVWLWLRLLGLGLRLVLVLIWSGLGWGWKIVLIMYSFYIHV